jgi:hypothetical protein
MGFAHQLHLNGHPRVVAMFKLKKPCDAAQRAR